MRRYFFDFVGLARLVYDFHGRQFADPLGAHQAAQLLALNLEVEGDEDFVGGHVDVRDPRGGAVFSVAIRTAEQQAGDEVGA